MIEQFLYGNSSPTKKAEGIRISARAEGPHVGVVFGTAIVPRSSVTPRGWR